MRLHRRERNELQRLTALQKQQGKCKRKYSTPRTTTPRFHDPGALERAWRKRRVQPLPNKPGVPPHTDQRADGQARQPPGHPAIALPRSASRSTRHAPLTSPTASTPSAAHKSRSPSPAQSATTPTNACSILANPEVRTIIYLSAHDRLRLRRPLRRYCGSGAQPGGRLPIRTRTAQSPTGIIAWIRNPKTIPYHRLV